IEECIGSGMCASGAPTLFELGPDGVVVPLKEVPLDSELDDLHEAVTVCPVQAIHVEEDDQGLEREG
ncbi:MAG: ferredoxin, partial [Solirubrobacterales bacterium]